MNRFARMSQQAGLSPELRQRLLQESQQDQISDGLRRDLEASLRRQGTSGKAAGVSVDALVAGAQALPPTISGPVAVRLPGSSQAPRKPSGEKRSGDGGKAGAGAQRTTKPGGEKREEATAGKQEGEEK
jgi:hypothetical protein